MPLPPRAVPYAIVSRHPELLLVDATATGQLKTHVQNAPAYQGLVQSISAQGPPSATSGWATIAPIILSNGQPAKDSKGNTVNRWTLSQTTLNGLTDLLAQTLAAVRADPALQGFCWSVQQGIPPGQAQNQSGPGGWQLDSLPPRFGIASPKVCFDASARAFTIQLSGVAPRHFAVYATFLNAGQPVIPPNWTSRLPAGAPPAFETAATKYAGLIAPSANVAGISIGAPPQSLTLPLDPAADSVLLSFLALGNGTWPGPTGAAGVSVTSILDCAIPSILLNANTGHMQDAWFRQLFTDSNLAGVLMAAGTYLLNSSIVDTPTLLTALGANMDRLLLDTPLADLHDSINQAVGTDAVENAAPFLNWTWATVAAGMAAQPVSAILSTPPSIDIPLGIAMVTGLNVTIEPDPARAELPDAAGAYSVTLQDADGVIQTQTGSITGNSLAVAFNGVRAGAASIVASLTADGGFVCAGATAPLVVDSPAASVTVRENPVPVTPATQYRHKRILTFDANGGYALIAAAAPISTAGSLDPSCTGQNTVCGLTGITLAEPARAIGYAWRASGQGMAPCQSSGGAIQSGYMLQNIGTVAPGASLKSLSCAFILQPALAYEREGSAAAAVGGTGENYFVDAGANGNFLRRVKLDAASPFPLGQTEAWGQLVEQGLSKVVSHPAGFVVAVDRAGGRLELLQVPSAAVADAQAPAALLASGPGTIAGLLDDPVAFDVTPAGAILTLENGSARVQAFDTYGNPVPLFVGGSASFALQAETGIAYLDLACSPAGLIYILSMANGGAGQQDYRLDVYSPAGAFVCRTAGVCAARIAVDSWGRVYTLNYATIVGTGGRTEPSISQWYAVPANKEAVQ